MLFPNPDWLLLGKGEMRREQMDTTVQSALTTENSTGLPGDYENRTHFGVGNIPGNAQPAVVERIVYKDAPAKSISKIVVFYSDNTFDTFVLEKKED